MKKLFLLFAAALMSASMFAQPATVPTVQDLTDAGYDLTGRVICLYFDEQVCNDIVWAGSYNEWSIGTPAEMLHFVALAGFEGWYVVEVEDASDPCQGKPVQLKKDGSFDWQYQAGDVEAWINMAQPGTKTATIVADQDPKEAKCTWPNTGAYIYEVEYFKNHNTPCGADKPKHDYTITAYLPEFCDAIAAYADSVRVMGSFDGWTDGIWMEKKIDEDFNDCWYAEIKDVEEGTEFKLRFGTDKDWTVQVQLDGKNLDNMMTGETTDIVLQYDGEGYGFAACPAPVEYKYTEYENWQIKYGNTWEWSDNMEKVEDGLFKLEVLWEGTGINVKSDENPIKKDWFAPEELVLGEEVIAPVIVDVYLKVIDDETVAIGVGVIPDTDPVEYKYTEYENWQIKYGSTWEWSDNMEKVEDGLFKLEVLWEGTGFNVKSDENPIKKDWFAPEELVLGEEVIAPVIVDVYLKVIDDETVAIGVGVEPTTALPTLFDDGVKANKFLHNGQLIIRKGNKHFDALGQEVK